MPPRTETRTAWCGCAITASTTVCTNCEECTACCQCQECSECHRRYYEDDFCPHCHRCNDHCGCQVCAKCNARFDPNVPNALCSRCRRCTNCCECWRCRYAITDTIRCNHRSTEATHCQRCNCCEQHCDCYRCRHCHQKQKVSNWCALCLRCNDHCTCLRCERCSRRYVVSERCEEVQPNGTVGCGRCPNCCKCKVHGVDFRRGTFKMYDGVFAKGQFKRNRLLRHIAAEIEVDKFNENLNSRRVNEALDKWGDAVVQDGSICGFEINTNPCNGDLWFQHLEEICKGLAIIKADCTNACGLHVHVNAKDLSAYDLRRLILLYRKTERGLFELCHPRRLNANYSQVCGAFFMLKDQNPEQFRKELMQKMYLNGGKLPTVKDKGKNAALVETARQVKQTKAQKYHGIRYKALNLHSFFLRGSVEFRHHEGTVDFTEITNWGLVCAHVIDAAAKWPESKVLALPGDIRTEVRRDEKPYELITSAQSREALLAVLPQHLRDWAERKWQSNETMIPRYKAQIEETWRTCGNVVGRADY